MKMKIHKLTILFIIQYSIFFTIINGFISQRINTITNINFFTTYLILTAIITLTPIITTIERNYPKIKTTFTTTNVLFGGIIIFLPIVIIEYLASLFFENTGIILLTIIPIMIYAHYNAKKIRITKEEIKLKNIKKEITIAQITDLHLGTTNTEKFCEKVSQKIKKINPDILAITGDTYDGSGKIEEKLVKPLKKLKMSKVAVIGNHDLYSNADRITRFLEKQGITVLRTKTKTIKGICFVGMDCPRYEKSKDENKILKKMKLPKTKPKILLYHTPTGTKEAIKKEIDLMLSGHTHGGQIIPFTILVKGQYKYTRNLHKIKNMYLNVNQGTGTGGPQLRLGSKSEITIIKLKPKKKN